MMIDRAGQYYLEDNSHFVLWLRHIKMVLSDEGSHILHPPPLRYLHSLECYLCVDGMGWEEFSSHQHFPCIIIGPRNAKLSQSIS